MLKRMFMRYVLMNEQSAEGGAGGGASPASTAAAASAAPAAETAAAAAPAATAAQDGLKAPESLLGTNPAGEAEKPGEQPKPGEETKPIEYTDFKVPEGVQLDAEKVGEFKTIASQLGIPQEGAQKLMDLYANEIKQVAEAPQRAWNDLQTKWRDEVKNDPVIGGANLDKNLATTKAGLKALLGADAVKFFDALSMTGAGSNPDIVRGLMKAAAPHAPADPVNGNPARSEKSPGERLYPAMKGLANGQNA
jgi:hypothetical protein